MSQLPVTDDPKGSYLMPIHRPPVIPYAIGIDPDIDKSGLAVWSRIGRKHNFIDSVEFYVLLDKINSAEVGQAEFYVDAGWLNKGYHHYDTLPKEFETWAEKSKWAYMAKLGEDVGRNFGVGQTIVGYLRAHKHPVHEIKPVTEKWNAATLKQFTGWTKRTNEDSRDAARLCFQR